MDIAEFAIGLHFWCGDKEWRCTDIGSRVITAICISDHRADPSWLNGPPYACAEVVFDEYDQLACSQTR
uniref:hypothetical protein n=1 Tax=Thaumasiovibrio occultus TaxID=1891184 RepID=UPI000B35FA5F|nr:hypothetical protein [Thaumasiovibrio occultus]